MNKPNVEQLKKENLELARKLGIEFTPKPDPIEQVKKEWEEAGYLWHEVKSGFYIMKNNKFKPKIVYINKRFKSVNFYVVADYTLLNRLIKTIKALEIKDNEQNKRSN